MTRHNPKEIKTDDVCEYGCDTIANYQFKNNKKCCSNAIQKCKGHINKGIKTKQQDLDGLGLNPMQRGQQITHQKKLSNDGYARAGNAISIRKNELLENGKRRCDMSNEKMRQTKLTIGPDGLSNAQRSARKMADTRLNNIDETGLNQYQRWTQERIHNGTFDNAFKKALKIKKYKDTNINYQGSYEKKFLEKLECEHGLEWVIECVSRGPSLRYLDETGYERWYISDFMIGNIVYEIKSNWTFNNRGKDRLLEQRNINKLQATKELGYFVVLVREGIEIEY